MLYFAIGAAVVVALLIAMFKPNVAKWVLNTSQTYKQAFLIGIGAITTWYLLTTGVWYLVLIGAAGVVTVVWAIWFGEISLTGWAR